MIILDTEEEQTPKLEPPPLTLRTARAPEATHLRPRDRDPILPDYETSQAQHRLVFDDLNLRSLRAKGTRGWNSRMCRATMYAFTIYVALFFVVGVPLMMTVRFSLSFSLFVLPFFARCSFYILYLPGACPVSGTPTLIYSWYHISNALLISFLFLVAPCSEAKRVRALAQLPTTARTTRPASAPRGRVDRPRAAALRW